MCWSECLCLPSTKLPTISKSSDGALQGLMVQQNAAQRSVDHQIHKFDHRIVKLSTLHRHQSGRPAAGRANAHHSKLKFDHCSSQNTSRRPSICCMGPTRLPAYFLDQRVIPAGTAEATCRSFVAGGICCRKGIFNGIYAHHGSCEFDARLIPLPRDVRIPLANPACINLQTASVHAGDGFRNCGGLCHRCLS